MKEAIRLLDEKQFGKSIKCEIQSMTKLLLMRKMGLVRAYFLK